MHARASGLRHRLGHEGQDDAIFQRNLPRHQAKQHDVIHRLHSIVKGQRVFKLRAVKLGGDHIEREAHFIRHRPDPVVEPQRVGKRSGAIDDAARRIIGHQPSVIIGLQGKGLQLDADFWREPLGLPIRHRAFQRPPRTQRERRARIIIEIAQHDLGGGMPAVADLLAAPAQFHIRQTLFHHRPRRIQQIAVIMGAKDGAAEPGVIVSNLGMRQVFSAHDTEMVAEKRTQAGFHLASFPVGGLRIFGVRLGPDWVPTEGSDRPRVGAKRPPVGEVGRCPGDRPNGSSVEPTRLPPEPAIP